VAEQRRVEAEGQMDFDMVMPAADLSVDPVPVLVWEEPEAIIEEQVLESFYPDFALDVDEPHVRDPLQDAVDSGRQVGLVLEGGRERWVGVLIEVTPRYVMLRERGYERVWKFARDKIVAVADPWSPLSEEWEDRGIVPDIEQCVTWEPGGSDNGLTVVLLILLFVALMIVPMLRLLGVS
jgi:hypothetical protein